MENPATYHGQTVRAWHSRLLCMVRNGLHFLEILSNRPDGFQKIKQQVMIYLKKLSNTPVEIFWSDQQRFKSKYSNFLKSGTAQDMDNQLPV